MEVVLQRACGECTACCKTHAVYEIKKPAGRWCPHCQPRQGCDIYPGRPKSCRIFRCEWLRGAGKDEDRPDKTKIVFDCISAGDLIPKILQMGEARGGAFRGARAKNMIASSLKDGVPVVLLYASGKKEFLTGGVAIAQRIKQDLIAQEVKIIDH